MSQTKIVTLEYLESNRGNPNLPRPIPTLRLRGNHNAGSLYSIAGVKKMARSFMSKLKSDEDVKLEEAASPEATRKNKEKLRRYIGAIQEDLEKTFEKASDSLEGKTPEQQEEIVAYWSAVTDFLHQVLDWLHTIFLEVIELIKQGYKLEKDVLTKMFAKATDAIKQAFNNQLSESESESSEAHGSIPADHANPLHLALNRQGQNRGNIGEMSYGQRLREYNQDQTTNSKVKSECNQSHDEHNLNHTENDLGQTGSTNRYPGYRQGHNGNNPGQAAYNRFYNQSNQDTPGYTNGRSGYNLDETGCTQTQRAHNYFDSGNSNGHTGCADGQVGYGEQN